MPVQTGTETAALGACPPVVFVLADRSPTEADMHLDSSQVMLRFLAIPIPAPRYVDEPGWDR